MALCGIIGRSPVRTAGKILKTNVLKSPENLRGFFYAPALHFRYRENGPADNSYAFRIARTREQRIIRDTGTAIALHFQAVENIASLATKDTPHSHHSIFGIVDNQ